MGKGKGDGTVIIIIPFPPTTVGQTFVIGTQLDNQNVELTNQNNTVKVRGGGRAVYTLVIGRCSLPSDRSTT